MHTFTKNMDVTFYQTSDGMTFDIEHRAVEHERYIQDARITSTLTSMELRIPFAGGLIESQWHLMANQEQIEMFMRKYVDTRNYRYLNDGQKNKLQLGDWVARRYRADEECEKESYGLVTLKYVIEKMQEFIESVEEVTVSGQY